MMNYSKIVIIILPKTWVFVAFLLQIKNTVKNTPNGLGFCYWGTEWIAFRGTVSTNGSSWENQALWDFNHKVLPAISVFN